MKKIKCSICNYKFYIEKSKVKMVSESKGISGAISGNTLFDAIDCPKCGCQNILKVRLNEIETDLEKDGEYCGK